MKICHYSNKVEMGSCTSKQRRIMGSQRIDNLAKIRLKKAKQGSDGESNIRLQILSTKDTKAPKLHLEDNPLRSRRIQQKLTFSSSQIELN